LAVASFILKKLMQIAKAGADLIVVGNAIEKGSSLIAEMPGIHSVSVSQHG